MALGDSISGTVTYGYLALSAGHPALREQVRAAISATALVVLAEDSSTANHANRTLVATGLLRHLGDAQLDSWCLAVVSDATTLPGASDTAVAARVAALWNAFAGS